MILRSPNPVTLIGASDASPQDVDECLTLAPTLVAADGGAATVLAQNRVPEAVIGDFDSLPPEMRATLPTDRLHPIAEQETTDFEKCLHAIDAPLILAIGFTGRRIDHELAVYNALTRHPDRPCIVLGASDLVFLAPLKLALDLEVGSRLSLFPMGPVTGRSEGLEWPIDGLNFAPNGRIGTSNRVTGPVLLEFDAPAMLVVMPRAALGAAIAALAGG